jgi:hypothetical protein
MTTSDGYQPPPHPGPGESWPDGDYDAALHLLDRQVVDVEGRMVGKVDDVELTVDPDGSLVATGLLLGSAALLPRFGGTLGWWLQRRYVQMGDARADRETPMAIDLDQVADVSSEVHLSVLRRGLLRRRTEGDRGPVRHRLGDLMQMKVQVPAGVVAPEAVTLNVLDVRLSAAPDRPGRQVVSALVVGRGGPGGLLGYDRRKEQGPWLVARAVRRLHRHSLVVELGPEVDIVWGADEVRVGAGAEVRPLLG